MDVLLNSALLRASLRRVGDIFRPGHPVRFVTAASLFDGHDAAINIVRRLLQAQGAEVVHLGHNRGVDEVVTAAIQEDVAGVAVSSYQGGHLEYFKYLVGRLREAGRGDIRVFGGGGGTITVGGGGGAGAVRGGPDLLPQRRSGLGLEAMVNNLVDGVRHATSPLRRGRGGLLAEGNQGLWPGCCQRRRTAQLDPVAAEAVLAPRQANRAPVLGITGTGGSGKSSLTDELVARFRLDQTDRLRIAVLAVDPSRRRGGGALLGDRIRMNSIEPDELDSRRLFFRSFAARGARGGLPAYLDVAVAGAARPATTW